MRQFLICWSFFFREFGSFWACVHVLILYVFVTTISNIFQVPSKTKTKKASQIAKELSDLVVYTHAVKFRGKCVQLSSSEIALLVVLS